MCLIESFKPLGLVSLEQKKSKVATRLDRVFGEGDPPPGEKRATPFLVGLRFGGLASGPVVVGRIARYGPQVATVSCQSIRS